MNTFRIVIVFLGLFVTGEGQGAKLAANLFSLQISASSNSTKIMSAVARLLNELSGKPSTTTDKIPPHGCKKAAKNCAEVLKCGGKQSGLYSIDPDGKGAFKVYCDQKTSGGGWTVIQKRKDGSVDFYRKWNDYKKGFGNLKGEFWLGLDKIYRLTHQARNRLRVEIEDTKGKSAYAEYKYFAVSSEKTKYKLSVGTYSGTAGDSLSYHRNMAFTTQDRDNDKTGRNCAVVHKGAWWYNGCYYSSLNGQYKYKGKVNSSGVSWYKWKGKHYSYKRAEMKIRPE